MISNSFISSFIISWIFINWKISIGLLFYSIEELIIDGNSSFINFINTNYSKWIFWSLPIILAIAYAFYIPFIRTWINAFNVKVQNRGEDWNIKITREGKISVSKYVRYKKIESYGFKQNLFS